MVLFTMVMITLLCLAIASALIILAGGTGILLAFGDLIVFGLIVWVVIRIFKRRR